MYKINEAAFTRKHDGRRLSLVLLFCYKRLGSASTEVYMHRAGSRLGSIAANVRTNEPKPLSAREARLEVVK